MHKNMVLPQCKFVQNDEQEISQKLLTFPSQYVIIYMSRGESKDDGYRKNLYRFPLQKIFERKFQKPLDKSPKICYNKIYQMKERKQQ